VAELQWIRRICRRAFDAGYRAWVTNRLIRTAKRTLDQFVTRAYDEENVPFGIPAIPICRGYAAVFVLSGMGKKRLIIILGVLYRASL
jgi:hypothetical protein